MPQSKEKSRTRSPVLPLAGADQASFLKSILENPTDYSIVALSLDGTILAWNAGATATYGFTSDEMVGKETIFRMSPAEDVDKGRAILAEALRSGRWIGDTVRVKRDGQRFTAYVTVMVRRSAAGAALGFTMISKDLSQSNASANESSESEDEKRDLAERLDNATAEAGAAQALLHDREEMFRKVADISQQVFFLVSTDFKTVLYASPSYAKVWGRSCESLYERPLSWMDDIHPQDLERVRKQLQTQRGRRLDLQYRIIKSDGTTHWIVARSEQMKDAFGQVTRLCAVAMDISDLKRAQRDVVTSEVKYRRLFESAKDGILILDVQSGKIEEINPFLLDLLGFSEHECLGKQLWDIGFFQDVARSQKMFAELKSNGYVRLDNIPLRAKDGHPIQVEFVSNLYSAGGSSVIQCNIRDITERKKADEGLRRLASIIESSDDSIQGITPEGVIQSWNPASERLFGYRADEMIGQNVALLCPPSMRQAQSEILRSVRAGHNVEQRETVRVGKNGKPIHVAISVSQIRDSTGALMGMSAVLRDITTSKLLEAKLRQSQKMEGIGRLAGGIAHDFNNLLTSIIGYSEFLMLSLAATDPTRADVAEILKSGQRAAALTRQLLAFSRQQVISLKVLNINVVMADLDKMLRRIIGEHIEIHTRLGADLGQVKSDSGQIEQIIMNLCVNARDAMPIGGELTIATENAELGPDYVKTHPDVKAGSFVMISFKDTGGGMSAEVQSHIFEPFFTTKERGKGTGLGLSTVYGIVRQSGGSIDVSSDPGRGTIFKIYFPRALEPLPPPERPSDKLASFSGDETILLVEDDDAVRQYVSRVLTQNGYEALSAKTPSEAVRVCLGHPGAIDLMLSDVVMPEMLGYELAEKLSPLKPRMKVIFMSGYTEQSIIQRALLKGAAFIQKPMVPETIVREVRGMLDSTKGSSA